MFVLDSLVITFLIVVVKELLWEPYQRRKSWRLWYEHYKAEHRDLRLPPTYEEWVDWYWREKMAGRDPERRIDGVE